MGNKNPWLSHTTTFICTKYHWPNTRNKRFQTRFNKDHHHAPIQKPKLWYLPNGAKHITHFPTPSMETHERGRVQIFARLHAAWTGVARALERAWREEGRGGSGIRRRRRSTVTRGNRAWNRLNTRDCRLSTPLSFVSSRVHPLATCHLPRGCFRGLLVAEWKLTTFFFFYPFLVSLMNDHRKGNIFKNFDCFSRVRSIVRLISSWFH